MSQPQHCHSCAAQPATSECGKCRYAVCAACLMSIGGRYPPPRLTFQQAVELKAKFDKFVRENEDKLSLRETYPIDREQLEAWAQATHEQYGEDTFWAAFADAVKSNLTHVSWNEFRSQLQAACYNVLPKLESSVYRILVLGENMWKSNFWVACLVWPILKDSITHVVLSQSQLQPFVNFGGESAVFVLPDDMSYSGDQLQRAFPNERTNLLPYPRTVVLVPFICQSAKATWLRNGYEFTLPDNVREFQNLRTLMGAAWRKPQYKWPGYAYGDIMEHQALVYFDHKIADSASIPMKMIAMPSVYNSKTNTYQHFQIIQRCQWNFYRHKDGRVINSPGEELDDFGEEGRCPQSFYKTIPYSYEGEPISKSTEWFSEVGKAFY